MAKEKAKAREVSEKVSLGSEKHSSDKSDFVSSRGRTFLGVVTKKFSRRVVVELERTVFVQKFERFYRKKTRLHARLPKSMEDKIQAGDYIKIRECRPLSKIIHFIVIEKVRSASKEAKTK